jgi:hypothetical protein
MRALKQKHDQMSKELPAYTGGQSRNDSGRIATSLEKHCGFFDSSIDDNQTDDILGHS